MNRPSIPMPSSRSARKRPARAGLFVVSLLAALWPRLAEAQVGTPPQIFCGRSYVFAKAVPNGNRVANQSTSFTVTTLHFVNRIAIGANCPAGNPSVTMTANLVCTPGPSSGPTVFGPFTLVEGFTQIPITIPVPAGPARLCDVVVTARVTFSDGSILEQTADQMLSVQDPAAGNPGVPRLNLAVTPGGDVLRAHPGDERSITYVLTNNHNLPWNGSLVVESRNVADIAAVIAGPNNLRSGSFALLDPGGKNSFPVAADTDVAAGDCVELPTVPQQSVAITSSTPASLGPGETLLVMRKTRS